MIRNSVALEKDLEQVSFIKMRIQGIWGCPDQDQEVGAKHINESQMFQITFRKLVELQMKTQGNLLNQKTFQSLNILTIQLSVLTKPMRTILMKELILSRRLYQTYYSIEWLWLIVNFEQYELLNFDVIYKLSLLIIFV